MDTIGVLEISAAWKSPVSRLVRDPDHHAEAVHLLEDSLGELRQSHAHFAFANALPEHVADGTPPRDALSVDRAGHATTLSDIKHSENVPGASEFGSNLSKLPLCLIKTELASSSGGTRAAFSKAGSEINDESLPALGRFGHSHICGT